MTKLEPTQEKDLELAIAKLERTENDVKEVLEHLRDIKELSYIKMELDSVLDGDGIKKVIEEYAAREGFDDVLGIISDLIEERGDMLDYSIRSRK